MARCSWSGGIEDFYGSKVGDRTCDGRHADLGRVGEKLVPSFRRFEEHCDLLRGGSCTVTAHVELSL